jgi:hypothetical protein
MKKLLIVTITIALIFALATCNDDKGDDTSPCNCLSTYGTTAHLGIDEDCTCGGEDCECTEQFAYFDTGNTIKIRKEKGVNVVDMNSVIETIQSVYNIYKTGYSIENKITEIHITKTGKNWFYADHVMGIKQSQFSKDFFMGFLEEISDGTVTSGDESDD